MFFNIEYLLVYQKISKRNRKQATSPIENGWKRQENEGGLESKDGH